MAIMFVVALLGLVPNATNPSAWIPVVAYLLVAVGFGYFRFMKPAG